MVCSRTGRAGWWAVVGITVSSLQSPHATSLREKSLTTSRGSGKNVCEAPHMMCAVSGLGCLLLTFTACSSLLPPDTFPKNIKYHNAFDGFLVFEWLTVIHHYLFAGGRLGQCMDACRARTEFSSPLSE